MHIGVSAFTFECYDGGNQGAQASKETCLCLKANLMRTKVTIMTMGKR